MYYAFMCEDIKNSHEKRRSVREAHLANLQQLDNEGRLLIAGPLVDADDKPKGSLIIADFNSIADAKAWIAADPYSTAEVFARITVEPFKKVFPHD